MQCRICGGMYDVLTRHVVTHGLSDGQYRELYPGAVMVSESVVESRRQKLKGRARPPDVMARIAAANRGQKRSPDVCRKISEGKKGGKASEEWKAKMSVIMTGRNKGISYRELYGDEKAARMCEAIRQSHLGKKQTEEHKAKKSQALKGKTYEQLFGKDQAVILKEQRRRCFDWADTPEKRKANSVRGITRLKELMELEPWRREANSKRMSERSKLMWQDPAFIRCHNVKPSKVEKQMEELIKIAAPNTFEYNGDYSMGVSIGRKIPDFVHINGQKQVIEVFGNWYHKPGQESEKIQHYREYGFECLVVWENDIKKNKDVVINRVKDFVENVK